MQCLAARRMVEQGVRFVQLYHGTGSAGSWDAHNEIKRRYDTEAPKVEKPIAGLLKDPRQRGLLDSTLVVFGTEFGRTPGSQSTNGRDHHIFGFTVWMAGGGVKGGVTYGETDDFSYNIVRDPVHIRDFQATILHLFGIDHERFTVKHRGLDARLTGVLPARVIQEIVQ